MEQDEFLKDLNPAEDVFDQPLNPEQAPPEQKPEDKGDDEPSNRRERRLRSKLQAERESSIALAARLEALTEAQKLRESPEADYLKSIEKIYGTESPEATAATELLKKALADVERTATDKALERFREERRLEQEELAKEERELDSFVDDIEDSFDVTLDASTKKSFFNLLEKMSPKDRDGNVIAYADHHAVWEELQARKERLSNSNNNRARQLADRSVSRTATSPNTGVEADANERWLRDNGII